MRCSYREFPEFELGVNLSCVAAIEGILKAALYANYSVGIKANLPQRRRGAEKNFIIVYRAAGTNIKNSAPPRLCG